MPETYIILIVLLALVLIVILFFFLKARQSGAQSPPGKASLPAQKYTADDLNKAIQESKPKIEIPREVSATVELRRNLMLKVGHDKNKVERLLEYEKRRHPNFSEVELYRAAIESWEDDNR